MQDCKVHECNRNPNTAKCRSVVVIVKDDKIEREKTETELICMTIENQIIRSDAFTCTQKCDNWKAPFDMLQPSIFSFGRWTYEHLNFPFSSKHQPGLGKHGDKILVF